MVELLLDRVEQTGPSVAGTVLIGAGGYVPEEFSLSDVTDSPVRS
jgi:hypothetical protein